MEMELVKEYLNNNNYQPIYINGDSLHILKRIEDNTIDCVVTSPPYWGQRQYENGGIGLEENFEEYINNIIKIVSEIKRILKPTGSLWLNLGDKYEKKQLLGLPWRVAIRICDELKLTLRNSVIWNKHKGMTSSKDRLSNVHENIFHFTKVSKGYYFNDSAIRTKPRDSKVVNGAVVSATGVSGVRYKRQIELSTELSEQEKYNAMTELENVLDKVRNNKISDFRMVIRGNQRTTHSNSENLSGRAKELKNKGFYFLFYNPNGTMPSDIWDIIPEDTQKRKKHYAVYPEELCHIPILATCPENGIVLDPFCGTGTTMRVAKKFNRKSIGIDISNEYLEIAKNGQ
ncbi:DNA-methyltransferase [Chryseobacterium jejuense]|uniref:Methyltransferase n=3 Tax=Chryseobacterium jejuense TaxID=445960 RepID=A0ABY0PF11_CHRJE|nr:site-specific DNA-methyltransferase [Chryseobacterium jejuense]SDI24509.1 DNA methylase [Chryseobacterium jejuense]